MSIGWAVAILAFESGVHAFLTQKWHRAALLRLYQTADTFAPLPDMAAFITVDLLAIGVGLYFGWKMPTWVLRVVTFAAFFWFTAKPLRFISILAVVRYAGLSPAHILEMVPTPKAQRERGAFLHAETLRLMEELKLDKDIRQRMNAMTLSGKWLDADEPVAFLKYVASNAVALSNATFDAELLEFRMSSIFQKQDEPNLNP
jgi:hypothetical protein